MGSSGQPARADFSHRLELGGAGGAWFEWVEVRDSSGQVRSDFSVGDAIEVVFALRLAQSLPRAKLAVSIVAGDGTPIAHVVDDDSGFSPSRAEWRQVHVRFDDVRLYPGRYFISLVAVDGANTLRYDQVDEAVHFDIIDGGKLTARRLPREHGLLFLTPEWSETLADATATTHGQ